MQPDSGVGGKGQPRVKFTRLHDGQTAVMCVNSWELSCEVSCAKSVTLVTPHIIKINYFVTILMIVPEYN
jgi:hypothetical protein